MDKKRDQEEKGKLVLNKQTSDPPEINRGVEVIKYVREFFDKHVPIDGTSWKNIAAQK